MNQLSFIYIFALLDARVLNLLEELCIMLMVAVNSFAAVLNSREGSVYIVIHRQTLWLYHNFSVWIDTQDASRWDRNPTNFMLQKTENIWKLEVFYFKFHVKFMIFTRKIENYRQQSIYLSYYQSFFPSHFLCLSVCLSYIYIYILCLQSQSQWQRTCLRLHVTA